MDIYINGYIYNIGLYFSDNDVKDERSFTTYSDAVVFLLKKQSDEYSKLNRLNSSLQLRHYKDEELIDAQIIAIEELPFV